MWWTIMKIIAWVYLAVWLWLISGPLCLLFIDAWNEYKRRKAFREEMKEKDK